MVKFQLFNRVITLYIKPSLSEFVFNFRITKLEDKVIGIRSNLDRLSPYHPKSKHILMLDFDDKLSYEELEKAVRKLQKRFGLGDCEVFESSYKIKNGKKISKYHGYFFGDAWHYFQCCEIIHYAVNHGIVDEAFARWRMIRPNIVLRFSLKNGFVPKYVGTIVSDYYKPPIRWFKDFVYLSLKESERVVEEENKKKKKRMKWLRI